MSRFLSGGLLVLLTAGGRADAQVPAPAVQPAPMIREHAAQKLGPHTWVIPNFETAGVPNVGIVVGSRATLVIETGMGPRNGEIVLREAMALSPNREIYLATTHVHPEHDLGASAFPASTKMIRSRPQERDIEQLGYALAEQFARGNPVRAELLKGAQFRKADISFERQYELDLGGVKVLMMAIGPAHTLGDTVFFVEEDEVLFAGDVVQSSFPSVNPPGSMSSVSAWLDALYHLDRLRAMIIVPSHTRVGDNSMIATYRQILEMLQARATELKLEGRSADAAATVIQAEITAKYPNMAGTNRGAVAARIAYDEAR